ncbi:retropepsin-like aspartic protease [Erythrobacter mangrovi]|uniref:Retropepsin-like domain-containing protein n=1 Tax=Erythrobacter mangrovi TaxID=2739433 RepID=A0A7D3XHR2_9SPHN|nr:retropepsin-like aspartic protease [Erythrobacter mangrovi]QKG70699.1 retropepsin-like domain-containing protein [Erythrobacter mangrovi]
MELAKVQTGHELIEVTINGRPGLFVLDSGASGTVIHAASLHKYFDDVGDVASIRNGFGAGGEVQISRHAIDSFEIDGVPYPLATIASIDLRHVVTGLETRAGVTVDGVVGQDLLTSFKGIIDVSMSKLYLEPKKPDNPPAPSTQT